MMQRQNRSHDEICSNSSLRTNIQTYSLALLSDNLLAITISEMDLEDGIVVYNMNLGSSPYPESSSTHLTFTRYPCSNIGEEYSDIGRTRDEPFY